MGLKFAWGFRTKRVGNGQVQQKGFFVTADYGSVIASLSLQNRAGKYP